MLNRRIIRIKVFKVLFSAVNSGVESLSSSQKELLLSCERSKDLYYFLLNSTLSLRDFALNKIEIAKKKHNPTAEDLNPNLKFVNNRFFETLRNNKEFISYCEKRGLLWGEYDVFIKKLYTSIISKDYYKNYMESTEDSKSEDYKFVMNIFLEEFEDNEMLENILEDISVYWCDDVEYVLNVILKNIEAGIKSDTLAFPDVFLKDDDREFAVRLLDKTLINYAKYSNEISESVSNWDSDRIVSTDLALIVLGLSEAIHFPEIPIKVTINEYVEISKFYSTQNSRIFVNGLLDRLIQAKVASNEVVKTGRGLLTN